MKLALVLTLGVLSTTARAETLTVGLFAPTAPFPSTAARVELATKLATQFGNAVGATGTGKVYARAGDFASAVKKGEVTLAVVDATYLAAAGGSYTILAAGVRNGESSHGWILVGRGASKISDLKGKRILVPAIGGRESDFVLNVLLGGEVGKDFFAKLEPAPDTASALASLGLGKADAAVVPSGSDLPTGTSKVLELPAISGPLLVAYGPLTVAKKAALLEAAAAFHGDATVATLKPGDADGVRAIVRRFSVPVKRGPFAVPAVRLLVGDLVEGRTFTIERTQATVFAVTR
jgi:hypothetical protein